MNVAARVPAGPDSRVEVELVTNGVSWYLRSQLSVDRETLTVSTPHAILGLLPIGRRGFAAELASLDRISIGVAVHVDRLAIAVILGLGAAVGWGTVPGLLCSIGAIALLLLGVHAAVRIEPRSGPPLRVPVCLAHLGRARQFVARVQSPAAAHDPGATS